MVRIEKVKRHDLWLGKCDAMPARGEPSWICSVRWTWYRLVGRHFETKKLGNRDF